MTRLELRPGVLARGVASALVAGLLALAVAGIVFGLTLGDAGASWNDGSSRVLLWVALHLVVFLGGAAAGAVGTWQAAEGGAGSVREALLAGAVVPALLAAVVSLAVELSLASLVSALVIALGAALGGRTLARRLG